jgi:hydrogenase maturation protease
MTSVLIIGYGNTLRRDDGVGPYAAQALADQMDDGEVEVLLRHQLTPELAEAIGRAQLTIFIDAREDGRPGAIDVRALEPVPDEANTLIHQVSPQTLLACAHSLYGGCAQAVLYSVTGADFGYGDGLSDLIEGQLPTLIDRISAHIRQHLSQAAPLGRETQQDAAH